MYMNMKNYSINRISTCTHMSLSCRSTDGQLKTAAAILSSATHTEREGEKLDKFKFLLITFLKLHRHEIGYSSSPGSTTAATQIMTSI